MIGHLRHLASGAIAQGRPGGSVVITLSRPGTTTLSRFDRSLLVALQRGASAHGTPVRMLCLATPAGVRELPLDRPQRPTSNPGI